MFYSLYINFLYEPLYNALIGLSNLLPSHDMGLAIILLTIVVRLVLFPLAKRSVETQYAMRAMEPALKKIKEEIKDRHEQGAKMLALYREHKVNPLSSILLLIIQMPIILALYWVFRGGLEIHPEHLYSFVSEPQGVNTIFLGFLDITAKNAWLAILVGITQFFQIRYSLPPVAPKKKEREPSFKEAFARSMHLQMKYILPPFVAFVSFGIGAAISLYWITSNLFHLGQEVVIRKRFKLETGVAREENTEAAPG